MSRLPAAQRRLLAQKVDDGGLLTPEARELVTAYPERFVDERLGEGWAPRERSEAFYTFERVANWGATGPRWAAGTSDVLSPYCTRPFIESCFGLTPGERYLEAPHHRLLALLDPELLDHRFDTPFRPQRRRSAGVSAAWPLWSTLRAGERHGGAGGGAGSGRGFLDRWLEQRVGVIRALADDAPATVWAVVDGQRFRELLGGDAAALSAHRDAVLRVTTPLWLAGATASRVTPVAATA